MMVIFGSFGTLSATYVRADAQLDSDDDMDLDDDAYVGGSKLTYPGQSLTSTHAFMRCVVSSSSYPPSSADIEP